MFVQYFFVTYTIQPMDQFYHRSGPTKSGIFTGVKRVQATQILIVLSVAVYFFFSRAVLIQSK